VTGIGFTVALLHGDVPFGDLVDQTRMGALVSFSAALIAADAGALVLSVGRFGGGGKPAQGSSIRCARPSRHIKKTARK